MTSLIDRALATATDTKEIAFGMGVLDQTGPMFARLFPGAKVLVVADGNSFAAAGGHVFYGMRAAVV